MCAGYLIVNLGDLPLGWHDRSRIASRVIQSRLGFAVFDLNDGWHRGQLRSSDGVSGKGGDVLRDLVGNEATRVGRKGLGPTLWGCVPLVEFRQTEKWVRAELVG